MSHRGGRNVDWTLIAVVAILAAVGVLNLYSAALVSDRDFHTVQLVRMGVGVAIAALIASQDYRIVERWAYTILGVVTLLLVLLFPFGTTLNNSTRWLDLGVFLLQPSELLKIAVVIAVARYLHDHERVGGHGLRDLVVPAALVGVPALLVVLQPDLGTAVVIALIVATVCLFDGVRWSALAAFGLAVGAAVPLMWQFGMHDYQKTRVLAFLNPTENLQGDAWQVTQAKIAIGSGGWFGKGYLNGSQVQNGFVPEHENDFIFAHHGEHFGFVGSLALLCAYLVLMLWCLRIARYGRDRFAVLSSVGVAALFFWHVLVNIAMVTGMLPVVGLWLPFQSYGGSSTLTLFCSLGLLMSISMRRATF